jgi:serine/threonine protein kinase
MLVFDLLFFHHSITLTPKPNAVQVGTPLYMSPEVLRGNGYGFKSDIWSLGCVLYEMAMLRSPFKSEGLNLYGLFQKISKGDYTELPNVYSETLRKLAYRMISVDAAARPGIEEVCRIAVAERDRTAAAHAQGGAQQPPARAAEAKETAQPAQPAQPQAAGSKDSDEADSRRSVAEAAAGAAAGAVSSEGRQDAKSTQPSRVSSTTSRKGSNADSKADSKAEAPDGGDAGDAGDAPAAKPRAARAAVGGAQGVGGADLFSTAEGVHEKLKILAYDGEAVERLGPVSKGLLSKGLFRRGWCIPPGSKCSN